MDDVVDSLGEALEEADPGGALERWMYRAVGDFHSDQGFFEAAKERCFENDGFQERRRRTLDLLGELLRRAQRTGGIRDDLTAEDLSFLIGAASHTATIPLPGLRDDIWKRYLGVIIDGMRPGGASRLRPGAPPRRLLERPKY